MPTLILLPPSSEWLRTLPRTWAVAASDSPDAAGGAGAFGCHCWQAGRGHSTPGSCRDQTWYHQSISGQWRWFWQARAPVLRHNVASPGQSRQQPSPAARLAGAGSCAEQANSLLLLVYFLIRVFCATCKGSKGTGGFVELGFIFQDKWWYPFLFNILSWYSLNEEWGLSTRTKRLDQHAKTAITAKWKKVRIKCILFISAVMS